MSKGGLFILGLTLVFALYFGGFLTSPPIRPEIKDGWWDRVPRRQETPSAISPFKVNVPDDVIKDMKSRLLRTRYSDDLENTNFEYGFQTKYLKTVVNYWKDKYDWRHHEEILNTFPQYKTMIEGINVHFIRVKPAKISGSKPRPLLMVHGWPGSIWEFYKIIPMLTDPAKYGRPGDEAFEVICPSIPGYGFSDAPKRQGFAPTDAGRVFLKLMKRLGHEKFYAQGGDWGSSIVTFMAAAFPENVIGVHINFLIPPFTPSVLLKQFLGVIFPWFVVKHDDYDKVYPLSEKFSTILQETGYMHIQGTKPDTVGTSINDSPAGLAAYILEKFGAWTNKTYPSLPDGGITRHFTMDELLTNVMIYWVTGTIKSSCRFYKENFKSPHVSAWKKIPVTIPAGLASYPGELIGYPQNFMSTKFHNIVQYTDMPRGGHFAALEVPALLAADVQNFVRKVEEKLKEIQK